VDFVDIGFFWCEVDVLADFLTDGSEEIIVDEGADNAVLVGV
jgi:hypothetical protein